MATTLDGTTLVQPSECIHDLEPTGASVKRGSGKVAYRTTCTSAYRNIWTVKWYNLDPSERNTIITEWEDSLDGEVLFSPPDTDSTYTVRGEMSGFNEQQRIRANGTYMYTVTIKLIEAL